jgi:hypothetical protein
MRKFSSEAITHEFQDGLVFIGEKDEVLRYAFLNAVSQDCRSAPLSSQPSIVNDSLIQSLLTRQSEFLSPTRTWKRQIDIQKNILIYVVRTIAKVQNGRI